MGPHETEMRRQVDEGWIPDADYRVFQGGTFARDCCAEITAERDTLRAQLAAANERAERAEQSFRGVSEAVSISGPWACFHCGFITGDEAEAKAHFGDRDDDEPLCLTWHDLDVDGRASEYQSVLKELGGEREENDALRTKIEGLEYRVDGQLSNIRSFAPFRKCSGINEVFHVYDSMEGRALAAEAERDALAAQVAEWEEWFGCSSPHDTEAAKATILGKEQARANRLAARVAELEAHVERLRGTLERFNRFSLHEGDLRILMISLSAHGLKPDDEAYAREYGEIRAEVRECVAATPAQSLAKVQAAAIREMAKLLETKYQEGQAAWCLKVEAERLEAEAANG